MFPQRTLLLDRSHKNIQQDRAYFENQTRLQKFSRIDQSILQGNNIQLHTVSMHYCLSTCPRHICRVPLRYHRYSQRDTVCTPSIPPKSCIVQRDTLRMYSTKTPLEPRNRCLWGRLLLCRLGNNSRRDTVH